MSVTYIPENIRYRLWGKAAGRCEYVGCNAVLYLDPLTKVEFNTSYIAHIIADSADGPRGDAILSSQLKMDISNLMLLCDIHHRLIDKGDVSGHPVERLTQMKRRHEERIEILTQIQEDKRSHIILYGANIGKQNSIINNDDASRALATEGRYPAQIRPIEIGLENSSFQDHEIEYWNYEKENLNRSFNEKIRPLFQLKKESHFSIFALAPQPLLMELGRLTSDLHFIDVYQLHKEPLCWQWIDSKEDLSYKVIRPSEKRKNIALMFSLSATIVDDRIIDVLGQDTSIWKIIIEEPNNDFLKSKKQLEAFRICYRKVLDDIKATHGQDGEIHLFPAVPVSIAVEIGRCWNPKADLPLTIYDQNMKFGKFREIWKLSYK